MFQYIYIYAFPSQILQIQEEGAETKNKFLRFLPFVPTTLATLVFCRLAELTIHLEGSDPIQFDQWELLVQERAELLAVSNDIKVIGKDLLE